MNPQNAFFASRCSIGQKKDAHLCLLETQGGDMADIVANPEIYFRQFIPARDEVLLALEEEARREGIPIVGPVVGELLYMLSRATGAKRILELGTASGYSAIYLGRACESTGGKVIAIEKDREMADRARGNFQKAGVEFRIEIHVGEALAELSKMKVPFDFIFMDIDKEDYLNVLDQCERLLKIGGLMVIDNVAFQGADHFNHTIFQNPKWRIVNLFSLLPFHSPEKDGVCFAMRV